MSHPAGRHEPASAIFMKIRGSFMAIYVKNKSVEYRPEANCHLSIVNCQLIRSACPLTAASQLLTSGKAAINQELRSD